MELRVKRIKLKDPNFLTKIGAYIAEGGEYEIKLLAVVSDGINDSQLHLNFDVIPISVGGEHNFSPYGYRVYRAPKNKIPDFLDTHITILEDDSGIRTVASLMDLAVKTDAYKSLMETVATLVANPWAPAISIANGLFKIALGVLKNNSDDLWMQADSSFAKDLDEYSGEFSISSANLTLDMAFV